jgi:hypothetical protein
MLDYHSDPEAHKELGKIKQELTQGRVSNGTFVEVVCQNISNTIDFANYLVNEISPETLITWTSDDFRNFHEVFSIGRLSKELENNMKIIQQLLPYYEKGDFESTHNHVEKIIDSYYNGSKNKTGDING